MNQYTVYFAGALFDHKHLIGNAIIGKAISQCSGDRYHCLLPQDIEFATDRAADIRNQDLKQVINADLAIFNFDGTELDSGTVVEFMLAKFLDIPAVIVRSDFRSAGDQGPQGDNWNLMCSFYPRTETLQFNAMAWYKEAIEHEQVIDRALANYAERIANLLVTKLDNVRQQPALLQDNQVMLQQLYAWSAKFAGGGLGAICDQAFLLQAIEKKREKGIY